MATNSGSSVSSSKRFTVVILCVIAIIASSCYKMPRYHALLWHSKEYYVDLAKSCDSLLFETNHIATTWTMRGDDPALPKPLLDLHATKVEVNKEASIIASTNTITNVQIIFGEYEPDYIIWWTHSDYGNGNCPWELIVANEGKGKILLSITNLAAFAQ